MGNLLCEIGLLCSFDCACTHLWNAFFTITFVVPLVCFLLNSELFYL